MFIPYTGAFNGILDILGIINNAKFIFSPYKRLTKNFKDELIEVRRTSDYTSKWFGYKANGDVDKEAIVTWVGAGNNGLIRQVNNQANINYPAQQLTTSSEPKIVDNGVFLEDGILFDGVNDFLKTEDYAGIQLTTYPLSIYMNHKTITTSTTEYIFTKNLNTTTVTFALIRNSADKMYFKIYTTNIATTSIGGVGTHKIMASWIGYNSNEVLLNYDGNENTGTRNSISADTPNIIVGARSANTDGSVGDTFFNGNIKSIIVFNSNEYNNYNNLSEVI